MTLFLYAILALAVTKEASFSAGLWAEFALRAACDAL